MYEPFLTESLGSEQNPHIMNLGFSGRLLNLSILRLNPFGEPKLCRSTRPVSPSLLNSKKMDLYPDISSYQVLWVLPM